MGAIFAGIIAFVLVWAIRAGVVYYVLPLILSPVAMTFLFAGDFTFWKALALAWLVAALTGADVKVKVDE